MVFYLAIKHDTQALYVAVWARIVSFGARAMRFEPPTGKPPQSVSGGNQFVTFRDLEEETGWSRRTIYRRIADKSIQRPVKINKRANGWPRAYITELLAKIARGEAAWQI